MSAHQILAAIVVVLSAGGLSGAVGLLVFRSTIRQNNAGASKGRADAADTLQDAMVKSEQRVDRAMVKVDTLVVKVSGFEEIVRRVTALIEDTPDGTPFGDVRDQFRQAVHTAA